jgi:hypothetical protein
MGAHYYEAVAMGQNSRIKKLRNWIQNPNIENIEIFLT